jgi:hypothetical protein
MDHSVRRYLNSEGLNNNNNNNTNNNKNNKNNNTTKNKNKRLDSITQGFKKKKFAAKWLVPLIAAAVFGISTVALARAGYLPSSMSWETLRNIDKTYDVKYGLIPSTLKMFAQAFFMAAKITGKSVVQIVRGLFGAAWKTTPIFRFIFGSIFFDIRSKPQAPLP